MRNFFGTPCKDFFFSNLLAKCPHSGFYLGGEDPGGSVFSNF